MKRAIVTGSNGFIGKNLVQFLDKRADIEKIIVVDSYITSKPINSD